eukprot:TRINITY_DN1632_c0_g1_i1.p1 TRINITY_DN1632_c0_g1~~TRINITY_DN1632_c0_g1_i1.p1  ORF type:complete len:184 (-),score=37.58 TRINITY_DN1632_c0_g1_i1:894-1445(-)
MTVIAVVTWSYSSPSQTLFYRMRMLRDKKFVPPLPSPTIGLNVFEFSGSRRTVFRIWDLGGEKELRKLWLDYYPQCHAVVFVSRPAVNDMNDSLLCFQSTASCKLLENVPMLLFINDSHEHEEKEEVGDTSPLLDFAAQAPKNLRHLHVTSGDANDRTTCEHILSWIRSMSMESWRPTETDTL